MHEDVFMNTGGIPLRRIDEQSADILFIREKFAELAALAWKGYKKAGRGFLHITRGGKEYFPATKSTLDMSGSLLGGTINFEYISQETIEKNGHSYPNEDAEEMVESYDTNWEMVVVIDCQEGEGSYSYRYVSPLKPALAFKQLKDQIGTA